MQLAAQPALAEPWPNWGGVRRKTWGIHGNFLDFSENNGNQEILTGIEWDVRGI
jgi:hypothetical protein